MCDSDDHMNASEVTRLESLWQGDFGDDYVDRNSEAYAARGTFWADRMAQMQPSSVLEVGCNVGANLHWIRQHTAARNVFGVDINEKALARLRVSEPDVNPVWGSARRLPFRDAAFDLVFTMGVLIHQPDQTLPLVMAEMVRASRRWVVCGEYYAPDTTEVSYRGHEGALFKRDYGRLFTETFPELTLRGEGFLSHDEGWDDVTWWAFEIT